MNNFRLPRGWPIYFAEECLMCCTIQQGGKVWGRGAFHVMSLVEVQKDSAFSFLLCNVVCRLPTTTDSSGNLVLWDKVSLPRSHRLSYHVDWCTFVLFFPVFTFFSFLTIFFFLAILIPHKKTTILSGQVMVGFFLSFLYKFIIFSSLHKACHMDSYDKNYGFFFFF